MTPAGPLTGIRVVEVSSLVLGPTATQTLGDMGADVIKVETLAGDQARVMGQHRSELMAALFLGCNRNKRSVALDLRREEARVVLHRLTAASDVVVHSLRSAAARRSGLDDAQLRPYNGALIHCHLKGFADGGVYADKPAYDDIIQALSGLATLQATVAGEPRYVPMAVADKLGGVYAAQAVLLALLHRFRTGDGQAVSVSMLEAVTAFNSIEHLAGRTFEPPLGKFGYAPLQEGVRRPYATRDGYLALLAVSDAQWRRLLDVVGRPELVDDPRFGTAKGRQQDFKAVWEEMGRELRRRTTAEWSVMLDAADLPFAVVNELEDLLTDPHLRTTMWDLHDHPSEGTLRMVRNPVELAASPASIRRLPPRLGEHTEEVLAELDFSPAEIEDLVANGVVGKEDASGQ